MQEHDLPPGEYLRLAMRRWVSGVAICTSQFGEHRHGMTVNSFVSVSLDPPLISVNMHRETRTYSLVKASGVYAVTILSANQQALAELFAGRRDEHGDRMAGLDTFQMITGAPLLCGGLAFFDCKINSEHPLSHSSLMIGEVLASQTSATSSLPLVYFNRGFSQPFGQ